MGKYSTEVRFICESYAGLLESVGYNKVDEVIEKARSKVFDFNYPIFDEAYRCVLETKILKHFYTKEIGGETVGLWKLWLNTRMNEIMPYYNKLYESELLEFNPLYDIDYTRTQKNSKQGTKEDTGETSGTITDTRETTGTGSGTGKTNYNDNGSNTSSEAGETRLAGATHISSQGSVTISDTENNHYSDTPQGGVENLENYSYLTNARKITKNGSNSNTSSEQTTNDDYTTIEKSASSTTENSGNSSSENTNNFTENAESSGTRTSTSKVNSVVNNTEDYLEKVQGKQGGVSYSKMLEEYRATFLNIDKQVINELNDLFINLW